MTRWTRQIATTLMLLLAAFIVACPLLACSSEIAAQSQHHAASHRHDCCPRDGQSSDHSSKSGGECPLLRPELRAAIVESQLAPTNLVVLASESVAPDTTAVAAFDPALNAEPFEPDQRDLHTTIRVLRI